MKSVEHRCDFPPLYSLGLIDEIVEVGDTWECEECRRLYDVVRLNCGVLYWRDIGKTMQQRLAE